MKFEVHSEVEYSVLYPSTFIFNVHALRTPNQSVLQETLTLDPYLKIEEFTASNNPNRFVRVQVDQSMTFKISYDAIVDTNFKIVDQHEEMSVPVVQLDGDVIPYLFPSRYCQSDKLQRLAYNEFGGINNVFAKVLAITDWIHANVMYLSGSSNSQTSAYDTITERAGVCRDFAHLGIALCRALSIPARYFTGYAYKLIPQDFHACFEAYIGGHWILFDPTKLVPLNGMVKIASGRDAADAAIASIFGNVICNSIHVTCETLEPNYVPFYYNNSSLQGISYQ